MAIKSKSVTSSTPAKSVTNAAATNAILAAQAKEAAAVAAAAVAKAVADAKITSKAIADANASSKSTTASSSKVEGTSQTFGQKLGAGTSQTTTTSDVRVAPVAAAATVVKVTTATSTIQGSATPDIARNSSVSGAVVTDTSKVGIFFAAASPTQTSKIIAIAPEGTLADVIAGNGTKNLPPSSTPITEKTVTVLDSETLSKEQVFKVLTEAQKIDLTVTLKSKESDPLEFNSLQVPQQEAIFAYQHWSENESDTTIQEDPSKDPLLTQRLRSVPRYIELRWESLNVVEQVTENNVPKDLEIQKIKESAFINPRGIGNLANSITQKPIGNSSKNLNMTSNGTTKGKIVDIHEIEKGFDSVSNKHEFVNSVPTIIKIQQNSVAGLFTKIK